MLGTPLIDAKKIALLHCHEALNCFTVDVSTYSNGQIRPSPFLAERCQALFSP